MGKSNILKNKILVSVLVFTCIGFIQPSFGYNADAVSYYNNGIFQTKIGNYKEAVNLFKKSIEIDPGLSDAYYNLGAVYEYTNDKNKAVELYETWIRSHPNDDETAYRIAKLYYDLKKFDKALFYINTIPSKSSKFNDAQTLLNDISLKANAMKISEPAVTSRPDSYDSLQGPTGMAEDSKGNLYVAQYSSNSIIRIAQDGKRKIILKGKPLGGPIGLVIDKNDNIYIANYIANNVLKISPDGEASTVLNNVKQPYCLYLQNDNILYISSQGEKSVIKVKI